MTTEIKNSWSESVSRGLLWVMIGSVLSYVTAIIAPYLLNKLILADATDNAAFVDSFRVFRGWNAFIHFLFFFPVAFGIWKATVVQPWPPNMLRAALRILTGIYVFLLALAVIGAFVSTEGRIPIPGIVRLVVWASILITGLFYVAHLCKALDEKKLLTQVRTVLILYIITFVLQTLGNPIWRLTESFLPADFPSAWRRIVSMSPHLLFSLVASVLFLGLLWRLWRAVQDFSKSREVVDSVLSS